MSGSQYLANITQNATRLGERLQETISEHTRELSRSGALLDAADDKGKNIAKQLDSTSDREKLDAMKRLIALISKGRNVSEYFAQVVKNVGSQNLEIRKLVYIYVLRYAEQEPDLALLSINTFQKDLNDSSPLIRAMALRVLSGIKVPMIGSIVILAIRKCAADLSPYVRKAAALAIPKCYELDSSHLPALIGIITNLLRDRSPLSIGCVVVAFEAVCPTRLDLLHKDYRRLCRTVVDLDEWGQVDLLNLLLRYARTMLPKPAMDGSKEAIDSDVHLLLACSQPLLQSRNPAVVIAVCRVVNYSGLPTHQHRIVHPLLRLLAKSPEVERVVVQYVLFLSQTNPVLFAPFYSRFLVRSDDSRPLKQDKVALLLKLITSENHQAILRELIDSADDPDDKIVSDAIRGIGQCANLISECTPQCLTALTSMIRKGHDVVVSNAVLVLKHLVQAQVSGSSLSTPSGPQSPISIISHLAHRIDDIRHADARACVFWLVGQYSVDSSRTDGVAEWAPDVLRKAAKTFKTETSLVKLQTITLASKLFVLSPSNERLGLLCRYVLQLSRYDADYDVRDRARMITALLSGVVSSISNGAVPEDRRGVVLRKEQVTLVLFEGKVGGAMEEKPIIDSRASFGTLSLVTGKPMQSDQILPDWLEQAVDSSFRDSPDDAPKPPVPTSVSSSPIPQARSTGLKRGASPSPIVLTPRTTSPVAGSSAKTDYADLDKFYEESSEEEGNEGEDDEEDEEEEEEEEEEESDEGSDEEDSQSQSSEETGRVPVES